MYSRYRVNRYRWGPVSIRTLKDPIVKKDWYGDKKVYLIRYWDISEFGVFRTDDDNSGFVDHFEFNVRT